MNDEDICTVKEHLGYRLEDRTLANTIDQNFERLKAPYKSFEPDGNFDEFLQDITERVDDGRISNSMVQDVLFFSLNNNALALFSSTFQLSLGYSILAKRAYTKNEIDKAWSLISEARYYYGLLEFSYSKTNPYAPMTLQEARSAGGKTTAKKHAAMSKVKAETIRLLAEKRPNGGWISENDAIKEIIVDLSKFVDNDDFEKPKWDDLNAYLLVWLSTEDDGADRKVLAAFERNAADISIRMK